MPERIAPPYTERSGYFVPIAVGFSTLIAIAVGAYIYFSQTYPLSIANSRPDFKSVYEQLGLSPASTADVEKSASGTKFLGQLQREPCDREAILPLVKLLVSVGYPRDGATAARKFGERCGHNSQLLEEAYAALTRINDFSSAVAVANEMIKLDQARSRYRYLRGTAYEGMKNPRGALSDYVSALQLFTDLSNVSVSEFYRISRMYAAIGRYCDAITPLEMYISYNVTKRQTPQLTKMITEYANDGNCRASYASGSDKVWITQNNIVDVTINGVKARMIVDTGASMVSITPGLAARARILPDEQNLMTFQVVGGTVQSAPGYAQLIQVGQTSATSVPVAISVGRETAFGDQIDGLLGMTFLARFNVTFSSGILELKPRALN
ncbi:MAG: retroviral-like aspartic protease family protein [Afipia sp.]|nr:retroviral-like aspartic protease family protein [Afipia sp.]